MASLAAIRPSRKGKVSANQVLTCSVYSPERKVPAVKLGNLVSSRFSVSEYAGRRKNASPSKNPITKTVQNSMILILSNVRVLSM